MTDVLGLGMKESGSFFVGMEEKNKSRFPTGMTNNGAMRRGLGGVFAGDGVGVVVRGSSEVRYVGPLGDVERSARVDAAIGTGVLGDDVVLAELLLDDAAALCLLGAGETRPVDDESLAADETADVAAFVRESAKDLVHRGAS
jgi:hypothetical protein